MAQRHETVHLLCTPIYMNVNATFQHDVNAHAVVL